MANTVTKIKDLYVVYNNDTNVWEELVDVNSTTEDAVSTASDFTVTDENSVSQEYRVVFGDLKRRPKTQFIRYELEFFLKKFTDKYTLDFTHEENVTKKNYVDVTDPANPIWLVGNEIYEDDLDNEILNEVGESFDPKRYEQKKKDNILTEYNFFVKTFGISGAPEFDFQYGTIYNQAVKHLS